ncbi:MAG: hypothetical protein EBY29_17795, partial [Planctomycetes bacterium]|nr:hypothetical protein [Planctomycetota bacterium]
MSGGAVMASSGKIIKGLDQFMDQMKVMRSDDLYKILHKAEIKALTRPRDKIAGIYAGFKGKHDLNQTQSELNSRWRAAKHQPIHPIRESRIGIAQNIYHNRIRPKNIGKNDASVWARIFGHTRNSWLIEHGRYRDPSRAYTGWQIFR